MEMEPDEFKECTTVKLDWTIRGVKDLFESTKGDLKSKVCKSSPFGGGRWQILFYPNSGNEGGGFISLFLSYEPTLQEREKAVDGKWGHEGKYNFSFEIRNLAKTTQYGQKKEANDHVFNSESTNWGWAQFCRRDSIYYQPSSVRNQDAFVIMCSITSLPKSPEAISNVPQRTVPKALIDSVGMLLDDPTYSDVEFVIASRGGNSSSRASKPKKIYASKRILRQADYFRSMFQSGFAESGPYDCSFSVASRSSESLALDSTLGHSGQATTSQSRVDYEDSDEEEEGCLTDSDADDEPEEQDEDDDLMGDHAVLVESQQMEGVDSANVRDSMAESILLDDLSERNVQPKLSRDSSPRSREVELPDGDRSLPSSGAEVAHKRKSRDSKILSGPGKVKVVVKDVAYTTYRAVLFYLYTNCIRFAPLASTFVKTSGDQTANSDALQSPTIKTQGEGQNVAGGASRMVAHSSGPSSRRQWMKDWSRKNPTRILPCSAKAAYRVADKLDLTELKGRAFQHITNSMTIHNVALEMFSTFSATFDEVRKMQIDYFLKNWNEIRSSDSMRIVWQQIRAGRHPGFEEVWPLIAMNLEFKPRDSDVEERRDDNGV